MIGLSKIMIPEGFDKASPRPGLTMLVARGLDATELASRILTNPTVPPRYFGRTGLHAISLVGGDAVIRSYRHGGPFRLVTRGWFMARPPRPFAELTVTVAAKERGLATPDVLAALVSWGLGPWYRGWLVTRELAGAQDLWAWLRQDFAAEVKQILLQEVGRSLYFMHRSGIDHADLNLRNILVRNGESSPEIYFIDFDRARLFPGPVPGFRARQNVRRLSRSLNKLDPERLYVSTPDWNSLLDAYGFAA